MNIKKYSIVLLFLVLALDEYAQSNCTAVQLKFYPTSFSTYLKGKSGSKESFVYKIRYKIIKNSTRGAGGIDTVLFDTNEKKCYLNKSNSNGVYSLQSLNRKEDPFYATLCFEGNVDLSDYYIDINCSSYGWNHTKKSKNKPNCTPGNYTSSSGGHITTSLNALNSDDVMKSIQFMTDSPDWFRFITKIEKKLIPYPQYSMPDGLQVCKNEVPFILNLEKYSHNVKMKYFSDHSTTITKYNTSTHAWDVFNGYSNSADTTFTFNSISDGGRFAVYTRLNNDCQMTDTFDLTFIDTAIVATPVPPVICQNGVGTTVIPPLSTDTSNVAYLWKDVFGNCLSRYRDLSVEDTGIYTVTVTRSNGCYSRFPSQVTYKNNDIVKFESSEILSCFETPNEVTLSVPLEFSEYAWSNGVTTSSTTVTRPGVYKLTVTDADNCVSSATVSVIDTCIVPVHSDVTAHSWIAKVDKIDFEDEDKNVITITDPRSLTSSIPYGNDDVVERKAFVRLQYHRSELSDFKDSIWTLSVPYQITIDGGTPVSKTLMIKKSDQSKGIYESIFEHEGGDEIIVDIDESSISVIDRNGNALDFSDIPSDLNLEAELQVLHVTKFAPGNSGTEMEESSLSSVIDDSNKKLNIVWAPVKEAIEYELQVVFIDDLDKNTTINASLFKSKGWSIITSNNEYTLDATYPVGKLVYRIRPLGRNIEMVNKNFNHILYGKWSSAQEVEINETAGLTPFEPEKNWSKVVTFAEEGKKKEVISYMDGGLRNKQVLTNLNTEKLTLAAETYYDHESRGTLNVMPVPLQDNNLLYKDNLSRVNYSTPIDKDFVDSEDQYPLDVNSGAAKYYSQYNSLLYNSDFTNKVTIADIPDAEGYVTTKVEYSRDNTGRIVKQSGIGKEFKIGDPDVEGHHFTQYFYTTPTQTELNRLFGSNVGKAVYYSKNMVVDPNGQVSVSYLDSKERVIATALAGNNPINLESLDVTDKPTPVELPFNMSDNNVRDSLARVSTSVSIITNDEANKNYEFHYSVGVGKDVDTALNIPYCKDCRYKLEIAITDVKGKEVSLSADALPSFVHFVKDNEDHDIKIEGILDANICNDPEFSYDDIIFNAQFAKIGNYTYTKKLTLLDEDEASVNDFLTQIDFPVLDSFIAHNIGNYIDSLACRDDCDSRVAVYIRDVRQEDSLNNNGLARSNAVYAAIKDSLIAAGFCDPFLAAQFEVMEYASRHCDEMLRNIIRQISPGDKFFTKTCLKIRNAVSPQRDSLTAWGAYSTDNSDAAIESRWLDEWGAKIIELFKGELHPEYCHYENCQEDTIIDAFDIKMGLMSGFKEAQAKGYISATGSYETNNRNYTFGGLLQDEINNLDIDDELDKYIDLHGTGYLIEDPAHPFISRVYEIPIIKATMPRTIYYRQPYLASADSGYNTAFIYYRDSMSFDINNNHVVDTPEWDSAFWIHFSAAYFAVNKKAIAKRHEMEGCGYLGDEDALVKNMNMSTGPNGQAHQMAQSYNTQSAYCATCPDKAIVLADKLARECRAIMEHFVAYPSFRELVIDSLENYCLRSCGVNNPQAIITHNAIVNGDIDGIRDFLESNILDADTCDVLDILDSGIEYHYTTDGSGNTIITYVCETDACSIASIVDIANQYDFNYPKVDSIIFREGFDNGPSTLFTADTIYKNHAQNNGLIMNVPTARHFMDSIKNEFGNAAGAVCFFSYFPTVWDFLNPFYPTHAAYNAFVNEAKQSLDYVENFYDVSGDSLGFYLLNYTNTDSNFNKIVWQNPVAIKVEQNKTYLLSYYLANHSYNNTDILPIIKSKNTSYVDTLKAQKDTISCVASWNKYNFYWSPPSGVDSIYIKFYNKEGHSWGNDFSLDEIRLELVSDTSKPQLACPSIKDYKYDITPSEITASYASCDNDNYGGGLYTLFFVDSAGNRIDSIKRLYEAASVPISPVAIAPVYGMKSVLYTGKSYYALRLDGESVKVFTYQASCAMPDWGFVNDNTPECSEGEALFDFRNSYLNNNTNYACNRSYDTCTLKPHRETVYMPGNPYDSINGEWTPDTTFQACIDRQINAQLGWLTQMYNDSLSKILTAYQSTHIANCFKDLTEDFYYKTTINEYHYTLYYYDQNGSLVQTIPPAGVFPLPPTDFSSTGKWLGTGHEPQHVLKTIYQYNTRHQPVAQHSPDGGLNQYWYNKKGMLILSQNEKQKNNKHFSFTRYDALGRIILVGELKTPDNFSYDPNAVLLDNSPDLAFTDTINKLVQDPMFPMNFVGEEDFELLNLTQTEYDEASSLPGINQVNLHNRVSATYAYDDYDKLLNGEGIATIYSYDEVGNVKTIVQDLSHEPELAAMEQNVDDEHLRKEIDYDYDLVSGKVNAVVYNNGKQDQFKHRYEYDADNRITDVYTTSDNIIEHQEAKYFYYPHGSLARVELGNNKVQSMSYAYTMQGWLKSLNSENITNYNDHYIGAKQVTSVLGYYENDYKNIANNSYNNEFGSFASFYNSISDQKYRGLYNGNIIYTVNKLKGLRKDSLIYGSNSSYMSFDNDPYHDKSLLGMQYRYDQLNRIVASKGYTPKLDVLYAPASYAYYYDNDGFSGDLYDAYRTSYKYDANGNITNLNRNAPDMINFWFNQMDSFKYAYAKTTITDKLLNNRLYHVNDLQEENDRFKGDIDDQGEFSATFAGSGSNLLNPTGSNYAYDEIGQLVKDNAEDIAEIRWTPYGKIKEIEFNTKPDLKFKYDASGNRVAKILRKADKSADSTVTYYYRDAQGNPLDIVTPLKTVNDLDQTIYSEAHEFNLYGSSRIGTNSDTQYVSTSGYTWDNYTRKMGQREFELTNHLGNVLTTVSDTKYVVEDGNENLQYEPEVSTVTDYYPFGMPMPGRTLPATYDYHQSCTDIDSTGYSTLIDETYSSSLGSWFSGASSAILNPSGSGIVVTKNITFEDDFFGIIHTFKNELNKRYRLTFSISDMNYFGSEDVEFNGIAGIANAMFCNEQAIDRVMTYKMVENGTYTLEFMGTGDSYTGIGIGIIAEEDHVSDSVTFKLESFKLEEKTFTPQCSTDVAYNKDYADEETPIDDWTGIDIEGGTTSTSHTGSALHVTGNVAAGSLTDFEYTAAAYTTITTIPGYDYILTVKDLHDAMINSYQPTDMDIPNLFSMLILGNSLDEVFSGQFIHSQVLGACSESAGVRFIAQGTTTILAFAIPYKVTDTTLAASVDLSIGKINITGYEGTIGSRTVSTAGNYRFGFNGMEKDDEVKGQGNSLDFGNRIYDPKLGRWLSLDKISNHMTSKYAYVLNRPIVLRDVDGNIQRDASGNVIFTEIDATKNTGGGCTKEVVNSIPIAIMGDPTGLGSGNDDNVNTDNLSSLDANVKVGFIWTDKGNPILALKVVAEVKFIPDENGVPKYVNVTDDIRKTNCYGQVATDGQYMIPTFKSYGMNQILKDEYKLIKNAGITNNQSCAIGDILSFNGGTHVIEAIGKNSNGSLLWQSYMFLDPAKDISTGSLDEVLNSLNTNHKVSDYTYSMESASLFRRSGSDKIVGGIIGRIFGASATKSAQGGNNAETLNSTIKDNKTLNSVISDSEK